MCAFFVRVDSVAVPPSLAWRCAAADAGVISVPRRTFELEARKAKLEAKARRRAQREEKHKEEQEWKRAKREMAKRKDEALLEALQSVQAQNAAISSLLQKMADKFM